MDTEKQEQVLREAVARGLVHQEGLALLRKTVQRYGPLLGSVIGLGHLDIDAVKVIEGELDAGSEESAVTAQGPEPPAVDHDADVAPDTVRSWIGRRCGKYVIEGRLGSGGMGEVYRAQDPELRRPVAIKVLYSVDPRLLARFMQEARLQARVEHENICRVYEVGEAFGRPYIAMQLIEGKNLLQAHGEMSLEQKVRLVERVAEAVHAAHRHGLVHRDLKPANILVEGTEGGYWKPYVTDFGLARDLTAPKMTTTGQTVGTPAYMAPEQAYGEHDAMDARTDVYGLGATLYHLIGRQTPFDGSTGVEIMVKVAQEDPKPLRRLDSSLPIDLETIVMKCLEKEPGRRYASARALAEDLRRYLDGEPIAARPIGLSTRLLRKAAKHRAITTVAAVAAATIVGLGGVALYTRWEMQERARIAQDFGRDAERIDSIMLRARLLPLHDTSADDARVRQSMARIDAEMRRIGRRAEPAGEYALGRGALALGDDDAARRHLERAIALDPDNPDAAASLGLVLGRLYARQLKVVARGDSKQVREEVRMRLERELLRPALAALRDGKTSSLLPPAYVPSLIAFYENRYDEALAGCLASLKRDPWFYEAMMLRGETYLKRANSRRDAGDTSAAVADYALADRAFREAARVGESDPRSYEGLATLWTNVMQMDIDQRAGDAEAHMEAALQASRSAIAADSSRPEACLVESAVLWRWGEYLLRSGQDPTRPLSEAAEAARKAAHLRPDDPIAHYYRAVARLFQAQYETSRGVDDHGALAESIEESRAAIRLDPSFYKALSLLGVALQDRAADEIAHGADPVPSLHEAISGLRSAVTITPKSAAPRLNLGNAYLNLAQYERTVGKDPLSSLDTAKTCYETALDLNPDMVIAENNMAVALEEQGLNRVGHGEDPQGLYQAATQRIEIVLRAQPKLVSAWVNLGRILREQAEYEIAGGKDPQSSAIRAIESLDRALALDPDDPTTCDEKAAVLLVSARDEMNRKLSPLPRIGRARDLLTKALAVDPKMTSALQHVCVATMTAAEWRAGRGVAVEAELDEARRAIDAAIAGNPRDAVSDMIAARLCLLRVRVGPVSERGKEIDRGLEFAEKAFALNGQLAEAIALKGALRWLAAIAEQEPGRRSEAARASVEMLGTAIRLNPLLEREFGPILEEANRAAGQL